MIRVFTQLRDKKIMHFFKRGVQGQWSADEIDWDLPIGLSPVEKQALARLLTPVYLGEQTAMMGASTVLPQFFVARETEAQLYLATFLLDEARHFEIITRFYEKLGCKPLEIRELKEMFCYHHRLLKSKSRIEWMWGILVSDVFARHFYGLHMRMFPASLFGQISARILTDESRHQAFAEHYLKEAVAREAELRQSLVAMRDELLAIMQTMYRRLKNDSDLLNIDGALFFARFGDDLEKRVQRLQLGEPEPLEDGGI